MTAPAVGASFRAELTAAAAPAFAGVSDAALADAIEALYAPAAAAAPFALERARAAAALAARLGDDASPAVLAKLHPDVILAIAATDGDPAAVAACDRLATRALEHAAAKLRATASQTDDLRSELRRLLFTADGERPAGLATFTGRGDLRGYARVIASRALARRLQRDRREVTLDDHVLDAFTSATGPELVALRDRYRPVVDAALRAALAALSDRHRALLRYHLLDGWTVDQLGARYGVHRATAARWLAAARDDLGERLRADLAARLDIGQSEVASIVGLVVSRVDASLERLLAE